MINRAYPDLHDHLAALERAGLLRTIKEPVCKDTEMHPLVRWQFRGGIPEQDRKAFLFTNIHDAKGRKYELPVVIGALAATPAIYAIGMGVGLDAIGDAWNRAIANPVPPVVVNAPRLLTANWVFFPEQKYHFGRLSEQKGFSEEMVPKDRTVLMVEIPFARREIQVMDRKRLLTETIAQLREVGVLKPKHKILDQFVAFDEAIYPKYDLTWKEKLDRILAYTDSLPGLYLNGRHGLFCYNNMDHSMEMGVMLADHIASRAKISSWRKAREHFYEYRIVD